MRRVLIAIASLVVITSIIFFTYQHIKQQQAKDSSQMFDVVMTEKMNQLYDQAQDWSKPIQLDIHDKRLAGHYKQISEFLLSYWIQNINARNEYLRELKAAKWDTFLNVDRLDLDKKQKYVETEKMLADVRTASDKYQTQYEKIHKTFLAKVQELSVDAEMRQLLEMKLGSQQKADQDHAIFMIELQILDKAEEMFKLLKNYPWQKKDQMILFHENAQVKKFNQLYQDVLKLNAKVEKIKKRNVAALEGDLKE
ncbi:hypothetical protein [Acinetobacter calcoaceticus]|uniref:Uncharacterized protein n=1 Tax=Acinetobacter calcoaceticus ANC 3811 TaxID=1217690 RepID=R8XXY8_ACICA|nr:hypothetical protein [Acinetobacter calcoaceticus]EOQ62008.1 hypothetical protein F935_02783 [Acinetobacter calcoaceticus ANC 3811]MBJ9703153.1 hypothetical protein [Acinetobacter calcoaceticus]UGQ26029.1 hypothetical protein LRO55_17065 [Acinetobacter calcoaceticus]UGQ29598.1 hypothetical protein LRO84_17065 [Acinetobacter calcoaceticus]